MIFILKVLISLVLSCLIWIVVKRFCLYQKLTYLPTLGTFQKDENLLYDDYYQNSSHKKNNKLVCQIGVFRKFLWTNSLQYELDMLDLNRKGKYKILIVSSYDVNLELENFLLSWNTEIEIITFSPNLLNANLLHENKKKKNLSRLTISYSLPEDIISYFRNSDYKFDRILVRECLGNISNRQQFLKNIKTLLSKEGFINIRTFTFQPIFEKNNYISERQNLELHQVWQKQKMLIDYWNYNFSTTTTIINEMINIFSKVEYAETKLMNLFYLYNIPDFKKTLQIFFRDMGFKFSNIEEWLAIQTLNILIIRVR